MSTIFNFENPVRTDIFTNILDKLTGFIFNISLVIGPLLIIIAAFLFITAGSNPSQAETAKKMIIFTFIGLAVIFLAKGIISLIFSLLGGMG